jgi:hypothetical protein
MLIAIIGAVVMTVRFILQGNALPASPAPAAKPATPAPAPAPAPEAKKEAVEMKEVVSDGEVKKRKKKKKLADSSDESD